MLPARSTWRFFDTGSLKGRSSFSGKELRPPFVSPPFTSVRSTAKAGAPPDRFPERRRVVRYCTGSYNRIMAENPYESPTSVPAIAQPRPAPRLNTFDMICAAIAFIVGIASIVLGCLGLVFGCYFHFQLPPVVGIAPAFVAWGIVRAIYVAWAASVRKGGGDGLPHHPRPEDGTAP
jgi:hypothetical protein